MAYCQTVRLPDGSVARIRTGGKKPASEADMKAIVEFLAMVKKGICSHCTSVPSKVKGCPHCKGTGFEPKKEKGV